MNLPALIIVTTNLKRGDWDFTLKVSWPTYYFKWIFLSSIACEHLNLVLCCKCLDVRDRWFWRDDTITESLNSPTKSKDTLRLHNPGFKFSELVLNKKIFYFYQSFFWSLMSCRLFELFKNFMCRVPKDE